MTPQEQWVDLIGSTAIDRDGDKVGSVGQVYVSNDTDQPEWVTVHTGLFGTRESLAPLYNAQPGEGEVRLAVTKQQIKDAPNPDLDDENLDPAEVDDLYRYYADYLAPSGTDYADTGNGTGRADGSQGYANADTGFADAGATDDVISRREERSRAGADGVPAQRVRLRKYVVTEYVTETVPGGDEEVRVEIEPIDPDTDLRRDSL